MNKKAGVVVLAAAVPLLIWGAAVLVLPGTSPGARLSLTLILTVLFWGLMLLRTFLGHDSGRKKGDPDLFINLVEAAPDCIIVHRENRILYANQRTLDFFGVPSYDPFRGGDLMDFIHPRYHEMVRARQGEALKTGSPSPPAEMTVLMLDGSTRDIFASTTRMSFKGEQSLLTFFRDITDQVSIRRELLESRERLQLALEAAQDGVWDWDLRRDKMVYSRAWAAMLGFELEELQSDQNAWLYLIHPDDHARSNALLEAHLRGDLPSYETEVRLRHKDGHYIWVLDRGRVVERDSQGHPLRMTGTHRDITARKEAEMALEIRNRIAEIFLVVEPADIYRKLLETLIQGSDCPIGLLATVQGKGGLKILASQPEGGSRRPNASRNIALSDVPPFLATVIESQRSAILDRPHFVSAVGQEFQTSLVVPIISRSQVLGLLMVGNKPQGFYVSDMNLVESLATYVAPILQSHLNSEMREMQLRQAQKMEALGSLAGGISHDFNNILQAIMGFTTLARDQAPADSLIIRDLDRALKASRRGQDLVQRILLFSRREEQQQQLLDVRASLVEAVELLMPTLPSTIEIQTRIAADCGTIMADASQIQQVIMNLATNALHAMEKDGGVLEIGLGLVPSRELELENQDLANHEKLVKIWLADTGPGISAEEQERVFEPFFTTKEVGRGTGLGLSVVHGIVMSHRGEVQIDSRLGMGTRVTVYLPPHQTPALTAPATDELDGEPIAARPGARILFVDDEEEIAAIGQAMLEKLGFKVTALCDSVEALEALRHRPDDFDAVVADVTMPRLTGVQLAGELAGIRHDLPVVLITGLGNERDRNLSRYPGVGGVVHKPFGPEALCHTLNRVMTREPDGAA